MSTRKKRTLLLVGFMALLLGPAGYLRWPSPSGMQGKSNRSVGVQNLLDRYGFVLGESASEAGIDFVHRVPRIDSKLDHIGPQVAAMGASVSVVDFDRDGWQDFYVTNSAPNSLNQLYRNQQDGTFVEVAADVGLADVNQEGTGACMGSVWADVDNDGYEDVLVYKWGAVELFRNHGGESFECITRSAGMPEWANIGCATWLDYDRDGWIDLFLAGYEGPQSGRLPEQASLVE